MNDRRGLAGPLLEALEQVQTDHVSLACPDCAMAVYEVVIKTIDRAGFKIVRKEVVVIPHEGKVS